MQDNHNQDLGTHWRVLRDTAILSGVGSLFTIIKPLRAIILGRVLGPYAYGLLNIPLPYVQLLSIFANLGISAALLRIISVRLGDKDQAVAKEFYKTGMITSLISSIIWSIILSALSPLLAERFADEPGAVILIITASWMIPGITMMAVMSNLFLAFDKGPLLGAVKSIYSLAGLVLPVVFVVAFKQPLYVLVAFVLVESSAALIAFLQLRDKVIRYLPDAKRPLQPRFFPLLKLAHSFFYTNLGWMLINSVDRIMIQWYCATEILGFYAVAVFFVNFLNILPMNFSQAIVPPLTMTLSRRETEQAWDTVRRTTRVVSFILAPLVVFSSVFARDLVILLFSEAFSQAGLFLRILAFIALLNFLCKLSWSIIVSDANPGARSLVYILAAMINVALNAVLIPRYGGSGAAWASMISFLVLAAALQTLLAKKVGRMLPLGQILFFFVMAGISVPVYILLGPLGHVTRLIAGSSASFVLYIVITALTGFIRKNDIEQAVAFSSSLPRPLHLLASLIGKVIAKAARN